MSAPESDMLATTPDDARFLTRTAEAARSVLAELECPHCHDAYERDESGVCWCQKVVTADTLEDARQEERDSRMSFGWLYGNRTRGY